MSDEENISGSEGAVDELIAVAKEFESILEVDPDDQVALETLAYIYQHVGDQAKVNEYLILLGHVIACEGDSHLADYIYERMFEHGLCEGGGAEVCELVQQLIAKKTLADDDAFGVITGSGGSAAFKVMDELAFAWHLFKAGELTQDEYASVAHDLSEMAADGHLSTISVLHALEARSFSGMERLMGFVAQETKTPIVSLQLFNIQDSVHSVLPLDFMIKRGVIVFDMIADDALVAVMNPIDTALRKQVESLLKCVCHYYVPLPSDFDAVINHITGN